MYHHQQNSAVDRVRRWLHAQYKWAMSPRRAAQRQHQGVSSPDGTSGPQASAAVSSNKSHVDEYSLLRVKVGIDKVVRCILSTAAWIGYIHVDLLPNGAQSLTLS
ncbi:hypothetical protein POX_h09593 [Penicillium oxalicum]|uniref:hypothetical protein n=1 Tax=Penicillium oxalicum TaxID=69781 RepID=UPI0020B8BBB1|nr:hypothetical protein POX_h09593 [Penicillium oxalicum]KAI2785831.1 hypothetical protein POX_h09593 [Penicillium oxalicum]